MSLRVTLNDIARACNLGKSTVARVLSGNPHVSEEAKRKVEAKAKELDYRPDPSLRILSQHRWRRQSESNLTLALLNPKSAESDTVVDYRAGLRKAADRLGYTRYWVAEHHNMPAVATTNPPVLIAMLASATERIRLGSGGVMLPNHAPLVVAEQFALL